MWGIRCAGAGGIRYNPARCRVSGAPPVCCLGVDHHGIPPARPGFSRLRHPGCLAGCRRAGPADPAAGPRQLREKGRRHRHEPALPLQRQRSPADRAGAAGARGAAALRTGPRAHGEARHRLPGAAGGSLRHRPAPARAHFRTGAAGRPHDHRRLRRGAFLRALRRHRPPAR
ncbi:UNVERIFIED_CONTAM: hypothetical protein NCL1_01511 [Trichonephila clavipes]